MNFTCRYESPLGPMTMASDGTALTGLWFDGQKYFGSTLIRPRDDQVGPGRTSYNAAAANKAKDFGVSSVRQQKEADLPVFQETRKWLDLYFDGRIPDFTPALNLGPASFRREVWEILLAIPYGQTMTYGEIAKQIAGRRGLSRMSAQAVGGAVGHNPVSIIVPCHRVVGKDGSLTGYAGGLDRKKWLLELENGDVASRL